MRLSALTSLSSGAMIISMGLIRTFKTRAALVLVSLLLAVVLVGCDEIGRSPPPRRRLWRQQRKRQLPPPRIRRLSLMGRPYLTRRPCPNQRPPPCPAMSRHSCPRQRLCLPPHPLRRRMQLPTQPTPPMPGATATPEPTPAPTCSPIPSHRCHGDASAHTRTDLRSNT